MRHPSGVESTATFSRPIPAKAGIQLEDGGTFLESSPNWTPAFAGVVTEWHVAVISSLRSDSDPAPAHAVFRPEPYACTT